MLERDKSESVAIGSHVSIPHGDSQSRALVKKTGLAVMTYPEGISWNGERIRMVIGVASRGEDHLEILKRVAAIAADEESTDRRCGGRAVSKIKRPDVAGRSTGEY